jgi:hypothetical protein
MRYIIETIPHSHQKYNTIGDWRFSEDYKTCFIFVSDLGDVDFQNAIGLHEMTEVMLFLKRFSPEEAVKIVDAFDTEFEKNHSSDEEPGDDPKSPYHIEHGYASSAERMYIAACKKNWKQYEDAMVKIMSTYHE